jgi:hypothetical protein
MSCLSRNIIAVSVCAILAGCTVDNNSGCDSKYATDQELMDEYGLVLKPSQDMYINFDGISNAYADTMACMGMTATGPTVEFKSFSFAGIGGGWAFYHPVASTIWVNTDEQDIVLERDCRTDQEALKHEFVHHILHMNESGDESRGHSSANFKKCSVGVNTYY